MNRTELALGFTEEDWQGLEQTWTGWWARDIERPLLMIEGFVPCGATSLANVHPLDIPVARYPLEQPVGEVLSYYEGILRARRFYGDAWPKWWPNFGPGIVAGFLGAHVRATPETVWYEPAHPASIRELCPVYAADNVWWRRVQEVTRLAVELWGSHICVAHTDLGGNLDILASLAGTQPLLFALHDHPSEVEHLLQNLTSLWLRYYDELGRTTQPAGRGTTPWAPIWSPGRCYMLQSDFSAMISPSMFERFVLPDLITCCQTLDHSFYHMDGKGQIPHLGLLLSIDELDGIQWIPGAGAPPPEEWLPLLKRIRDAGKLCQLYTSPAGARTIAREMGGHGFAFCIDQLMAPDEAARYISSFPS